MGYDPSVVNAWAQAYGTPTTPTARSTMPSSPSMSQQDAWNTYNPSNYQSDLNPNLLNGIMNNGWRTSPTADYSKGDVGQFTYQAGQPIYSSDPNGNPLPVTYGNAEINYHPQGQGPGEDYYRYDQNGKFLGTAKGSKVQSYASGVLSVLGAAVGMGAGFGASAGADGYAAGGYLGGGGAGAGAGAAGAGAGVTGLGDAGTMYAGGSADAASSLGGLGGTAGATAGTGGTTLSSLISQLSGSGGGNSLLSRLISTGGSSLVSSLLGGHGSQSNGSGGMGVGDIVNLLSGYHDAQAQGQAASTMKNWLDQNQAQMTGYMNPGSPEYQNMWDQMSRNDAAAGRNSQYGPRTSDFLAKVAQAKASNIMNFTTGNSRAYATALNQNASKYAGLAGALRYAGQGGGNGALNLSSLVDLFKGGSGGSSNAGMSTDPSTQQTLDSIYSNGGAPIDYNAGAANPTEQDVLDFLSRYGE